MSSPDGGSTDGRSPRAQRPAARRPVVAVTGAASGLGAAVAARLVANPDVGKVVRARRPPRPGRGRDLAGARHPGPRAREPAGQGRHGRPPRRRHHASTATGASRASSTSAARRPCSRRPPPPAYAGWCCARRPWSTARCADNPLPLSEDAPLRAVPDGGLVSDWLEVERLGAQAPRSHPGLQVTVVRPATVVGPGHRQPADPALRGPAAAGRARLLAALAVLPRRRPRRRRSSSPRWAP